MKAIEKIILPNGLTVLLQPVDNVVSASIGLWVKTGSRHENGVQTGYAHFIEHMLFKGTSKYSASELARMVDRVGGQHNAATTREYTCYYINVVADYIDLALHLLGDMFYNSLFAKEEIEREKGVVLEEIKMYEDTPDEHIHDLFMEAVFNKHPLGMPILGTEQTIHAITRESLTAFYDQHYATDNTVLVVAGKFNPDEIKKVIEKYFSQARILGTRTEIMPVAPERDFRRHIDRDLEQVHFCLGVEGLPKKSEDRWAMYLLSTILGGSMSSRLFQNVREREGLCYSIYSFHSSYRDMGVFGIYCGTAPEKYSRALELSVAECRKMLQSGVTEEELADARTFMKGNLALSLESTEVQMGQMARNEIVYGRHFSYDDTVAMIDSVTMDNFNSFVDRLFRERQATLVSIGSLEKDPDEVIIL